jgi:hypothetical protein
MRAEPKVNKQATAINALKEEQNLAKEGAIELPDVSAESKREGKISTIN